MFQVGAKGIEEEEKEKADDIHTKTRNVIVRSTLTFTLLHSIREDK
jgi:hypothetical protein